MTTLKGNKIMNLWVIEGLCGPHNGPENGWVPMWGDTLPETSAITKEIGLEIMKRMRPKMHEYAKAGIFVKFRLRKYVRA